MRLPRRRFLLLSSALLPFASGADGEMSFRGKLVDRQRLQLADGSALSLTGDDDTVPVLKDKRLIGSDFEVIGTRKGNTVTIRPIHLPSLFVHRDGKRLRVTYWCDVCAIRTYTPGLCWCCREETELDPRDTDTVEKK